MSFIDILSKNHKQWVSMAMHITGNNGNAEDYVQEMYLRLHDKQEPPDLFGYVYKTIRSIYIDDYRRNKSNPVSRYYFVENSGEFISGNADDSRHYMKNIDSIEVDYEELASKEVEFDVVKSVFDALPDYKKDILRYSYEDGLREFCRLSGIGTNTVVLIRRNFKKEVWKILKNKTSQQMKRTLQKAMKQIQSYPVKGAENVKLF